MESLDKQLWLTMAAPTQPQIHTYILISSTNLYNPHYVIIAGFFVI